jgi:hypothetical protein
MRVGNTERQTSVVRNFLGEDRTFNRAIEYAWTRDRMLQDVSKDVLEAPGGVAVALLSFDSGKFILQQV